MIQNRDLYEALWYGCSYNIEFGGTFDLFVESMRRNSTWDSHFEIAVLGEMFNADVHVSGPGINYTLATPGSDQSIYLEYDGSTHYDAYYQPMGYVSPVEMAAKLSNVKVPDAKPGNEVIQIIKEN